VSALQIKPRALAAGVASFLPGLRRLTNRGSGGTGSARYCYSVWLRHLVWAGASGLPIDPVCVAELGPGDSLGTGLAAVLCGADRYLALDVKAHASVDTNVRILDELIALFRARAPIPDDNEFPLVEPKLRDYTFPRHILTDDRLLRALSEPRLHQIRGALSGQPGPVTVAYRAPWNDSSVLVAGSVDFLISQAVLEHVEDLDTTYRAMREWMKPGASMSHCIDFTSHDLTRWWNGHWTLGDASWWMVRGTRKYLINREPLSTHLELLAKHEFQPVRIDRRRAVINESFRPAMRFRSMSVEDRFTPAVFLQARSAPG
jgi:hypothetical protein